MRWKFWATCASPEKKRISIWSARTSAWFISAIVVPNVRNAEAFPEGTWPCCAAPCDIRRSKNESASPIRLKAHV